MSGARFVVDTSVVVQYLIEDNDTPQVTELFAASFESRISLWLPDYCLVECANVLWKRVVFDNDSLEMATQIVENLDKLPLTIVPATRLLARAMPIGANHRLAIYDCLFIALAEELDCPLITVDRKQAEAAKATGVMLKPVGDFASTS
ncbi:MAG: type II toxin-antitoxin system VapC family toxin [Anaerolineae bacterium]|nr:type II toxin-antitoxin system VapC family toxin [Anaerolineae bacterium]